MAGTGVTPRERTSASGERSLPDYRLDELKLDPEDAGLRSVEIGHIITDGQLTLTMNGASTIDITITDPAKELLRGDFLTEWTWGKNADHSDEQAWIRDGRHVDIKLDDLWFRLVRLEKQEGGSLALQFEDRAASRLREKKGARSAVRQATGWAGVTRAQFVKMLADEAKVPTHIPELRDPQRALPAQGLTSPADIQKALNPPKKSTATAAERRRAARKGLTRVAGLTVKGQRPRAEQYNLAQQGLDVGASLNAPRNALIALIAAYIAENDMTNHAGGGGSSSGSLQLLSSTAANLHVNARDVKAVATLFFKKGFAGRGGAITLARRGMAPADIATAIEGNRDGASSYSPWVREATRWVDAYQPGAFSLGGSTLGVAATSITVEKAYSFSRGANESSWDAIQRLAEEVQWRAFVRRGVLWYVSDEFLKQQIVAMRVWEHRERRPSPVRQITDAIDLGARNLTADLSVQANVDRWVALPGMRIVVEEEGPADGPWLVNEITRPLWDDIATIACAKPIGKKPEPAPDTATVTFGGTPTKATASLGPSVAKGGAKAIVDAAVEIAKRAGGSKIYVGSSYRPGSTTSGGGVSDHASNDANRAARDIGHRGNDLLTGPPTRDIDKATVAVGQAFGRSYKMGQVVDADTFDWHGFRVQLIWRTPKYGGHLGHLHCGAHKA